MLLTSANIPYSTSPLELMITALASTLGTFTEKEEVVVELEGHGRSDSENKIDISRTVGWFTTLYPVKLRIHKGNLGEQVKSIKEQLRKIPNKGVGYGVLKYIEQEIEDYNRLPIRFNYLGEFSSSMHNDYFSFSDKVIGEDIAIENDITAKLEINNWVINGTFHCSIRHFAQDKNKVEAFLNAFLEQLSKIINHCHNKTEKDFTPSDF
ncbi:non-ribosomal peptide synthase protein (TIGR01720 family) [Filibacter limicola]|uniref:Non-ribosomal peptide synthase protein (TIGR01720 family) n=2 Tax=Sporosarcina limicola TaxID=34101 RepID=A0A927MND0_9BACL|nr:non-ribosomal peptide synthase protein (TIGR01720 family) [Sporosarcina limicola]